MSSCAQLKLPHPFRVEDRFLTADDPGVEVLRGASGHIIGFDRDGDLVISFDGAPKKHHVFIADARNLLMD